MIVVPEFPPPSMTDPDDVGWPMCAAAAFWRQGRYDDSLAQIDRAASAAAELGLEERRVALLDAQRALGAFVEQWKQGAPEADPTSVPVSQDYPSIEVIETFISLEELAGSMQAHPAETPSPPVVGTLPSGMFGSGARPPKRPRVVPPKQAAPLVLDFDGSILMPKPREAGDEDDDEAPQTQPSSHPPAKQRKKP